MFGRIVVTFTVKDKFTKLITIFNHKQNQLPKSSVSAKLLEISIFTLNKFDKKQFSEIFSRIFYNFTKL